MKQNESFYNVLYTIFSKEWERDMLINSLEAKDLEELKKRGLNLHENDDELFRKAAGYGNLEAVQYLLEDGADIHAEEEFDSHDYTFHLKDCAFRWATANGQLSVVKYLAEHGADIHVVTDCAACDPTGDDYSVTWSELRDALLGEHFDVVDYLAEQGVNITDGGEITIQIAAEEGKLEVIKYLVNRGVKIKANKDTLLQLAKKHEQTHVVEYMETL